jgi:TRAP-type C4-dicarboxylate transport system permease large subunit
MPITAAIHVHQLRVGKLRLRILVQTLHVGVCRRGIEVVIVFLDVLAVIAFGSSQAEQALLQDRIAAIPKGEGKTKALVIVADAGDAVLGPAVGARTGMIVWKIVPSRSIGAVVFARIAPGALGEIGPPALPIFVPTVRFQKTVAFSVHLNL